MAATKIVLDRNATAKTFDFGTSAASGEGLVTVQKGTAALTTVVLDVKGSQNIAGDLNLTGNLNITGNVNTQTVTNTNVADVTITLNDGGTTPADDTAGIIIEGTTNTIIGALKYKAASATKWSVGTGASQEDIVGTSSAQTLSNKTFVAPVLGTPTSGNLTNCTFPTLNQNTTGYAQALKSATTTVDVSAATAPTVGQVLTAVNGTTATWQNVTSSAYQRSTVTAGTQDSVNKVFTIANAVSAGSEQIFINGMLLMPGASNDYVISGTTVTFQAAFTAPASTDVLRAYGTY